MYIITIDEGKCDNCGECAGICPVEIYKKGEDGRVVAGPGDECIYCQSCISVCKPAAITIAEM